jgi:hypothetical protein
MVTFHKNWFYLATCLFCLEIFIAAFLHDGLIRPYVGDSIAVIFLYCLVKSLADVPTGPTVLGVLLVAYTLEALQYVHMLTYLGLQHSRLLSIVLGSHFEWIDLVAYTLGALLILIVEKARNLHKQRTA